jgi:hypothetical protein
MAIYYLDVDDEITSAAARIRGSADAHIALVMPTGSRVATSRINFKLLEREAKQRNKRLAIVAPDPSVRSLAQSAGLPVFANVREYEAAEATPPNGAGPVAAAGVSEALGELGATIPPATSGSRSIRGGGSARGGPGGGAASTGAGGSADGATATARRRRRFGAASLLLIGLLAVILVAGAFAAYQLWPSATVVLTVNEKPLGPLALTVNIDPSVVAINYSTLTVPGITKSFDVNQSGTVTATGQKVVETAATGTVTFSSTNTFIAVPIPAGTQVSTGGGVAFATTRAVTVPKAVFSAGQVGSVSAPIAAVTKGTSGNVGAHTIKRVPSDLAALLITADNTAATTGGTHVVNLVVQQSDLDKVTADLTKSLNDSFAATLKDPGTLPDGVQLFADTGKLGAIAFDPDPATLLSKQGDTFPLAASATGTATEADTANVRSLAESRITSKVRSGYILVDGSVKTTLGTPTAHGTVVSVPVTANAAEAATVSVDVLKANIKGKSVTDARAYLSQFGDAKISLSPWWASTIPTYDFRIDLSLVAPNSAASSQSPGKSSAAVRTASAAPGASASGPVGPSAAAAASASSSAGSFSSASSVPSSSASSSASSSTGATPSATASSSTAPSPSAS